MRPTGARRSERAGEYAGRDRVRRRRRLHCVHRALRRRPCADDRRSDRARDPLGAPGRRPTREASWRRRAHLVRPRAASGADDARDRPRPRRRRSLDPGPRRRPLRPRRLARGGRHRSRCQRRRRASSTWPVPARSCAPRRHAPRPIPRPCGSRPVVSRCSKASIVAYTCTPRARSVAPSEHALPGERVAVPVTPGSWSARVSTPRGDRRCRCS